jgi:heme/copper-type cytochrome/quinol oxidase subunit 1
VYAFAVPVLGIAGDVLAVTARTRQAFRGVAMGAIAAFGALGFGAFVQLSVYADALKQPAYIGMSLLAVLPVLLLLAVWADLFRRGRFSFSAPALFAISAVLMLLVGVLAGAVGAIPALKVANTEWDPAVTHFVSLAAIIAVLGGLYWWATKVIGRPAGQAVGALSAVVLLLGTVVLALPSLVSALVHAHSKAANKGLFKALATTEVVGGGLIALGVLVAAANLLGALGRGPRSGAEKDEVPADPWQGQTLEWATPSPPPLDNFLSVPAVGSAEPLLDLREEDSA